MKAKAPITPIPPMDTPAINTISNGLIGGPGGAAVTVTITTSKPLMPLPLLLQVILYSNTPTALLSIAIFN